MGREGLEQLLVIMHVEGVVLAGPVEGHFGEDVWGKTEVKLPFIHLELADPIPTSQHPIMKRDMKFKDREIGSPSQRRGCVNRIGAVPKIESLTWHMLKRHIAETRRRHDRRRAAKAVRLEPWRQFTYVPNVVASSGGDGDFHGRGF